MQTIFRLTIKHSVLLEEQILKDIADFLEREYKEVEFVIRCADGSERKTTLVQEILQYDNANHRKILTLIIGAHEAHGDFCTVWLTSSEEEQSAYVTVEAIHSPKADHVRNFIMDKLYGCKFPYLHDNISRFTTTLIMGIVLVVYLTIAAFFNSDTSTSMIMYAVLIVLLIGFGCEKAMYFLFPRIFFNINRQKPALERVKKAQEIVFIGIGLAFVLSLIANYVSGRLFG